MTPDPQMKSILDQMKAAQGRAAVAESARSLRAAFAQS